jgi:hypothetical protein
MDRNTIGVAEREALMGSLTVHVIDKRQKPVSGKRVFCNFPALPPTHSEGYTDATGIVDFKSVPVCTAEVFVEGRKLKVGVGQNEHEDVTIAI